MPTIGEVFNAFALKAGIAADDEDLKGILAAPGLAQIAVPDALVTKMDSGLLNLEAAKSGHPDIKRKYFAEAYDGMDAEILKLPVDQEVIDVLKAEKSTTKKLALLVEKLKATKAPDSTEGTTLKAKINELQQQLAGLAEEKATLAKQHQSELRDFKKDIKLQSEFGSYKTIYDDLDPAIKKMSLKAILDKNLQDSNAVFTLDDNDNLVLVGKDGTNVFGSDHRQLTPKAFFDKSFASILKVSEPPKPGPQQPPKTGAQPAAGGNDFMSSFTNQALQDFERATPVKMI